MTTTITARDDAAVRAALLWAETHRKTTVRLSRRGVFILKSPWEIRGIGTKLDLNGMAIVQQFQYRDGVPGVALLVKPKLAEPEPWAAQPDCIWTNPPGTALTYSPDYGGPFKEEAPIQYPGPMRAVYTLARRILVPCENITICNGEVRSENGYADSPLFFMYTNGGKVSGLTTSGEWSDNGGVISIIGSERIEVCDLTNDWGVRLNSSCGCNIHHVKTKSVLLEECCVGNDIHDVESLVIYCYDPSCSRNLYRGNKVRQIGTWEDSPSIVGNTASDQIWVNKYAKRGFVANNTAPLWYPFNGATVQERGNSWN